MEAPVYNNNTAVVGGIAVVLSYVRTRMRYCCIAVSRSAHQLVRQFACSCTRPTCNDVCVRCSAEQ